MSQLFTFFPIAQAIAAIFDPHVEVIIHDLKTGLIAAIYHSFSKRKVGDESLLDDIEEFQELPNVFPSYIKTNWDGKKIKSISATIRDEKNKPIALLCINVDLTKWDELHDFLGQLLSKNHSNLKPAVLFNEDWREKINVYVSNYLKNENLTFKQLSKEKKKELVLALHADGAFNASHAAQYVADVLNLSRATIYNYLKSQVNA